MTPIQTHVIPEEDQPMNAGQTRTWFHAAMGLMALGLMSLTGVAARAAGLQVNAGHDLTVKNLPDLAKRIPALAEVSIGHGLTADALEYGMAGTVGRFLKACGW